MEQPPPWKVGLPFAVGVAIAVIVWFLSRQPTALIMAGVFSAWGSVWVYGAWRSLRDTARLAQMPPFTPPAAGQALVISRARRGLFSRRGYILATVDRLMWWEGDSPPSHNPGDAIIIGDLPLSGARPETLALFAQIKNFRYKADFIGGDTLIIMFSDRTPLRLTVYDPEAFSLIFELLDSA